MRIPTLTTRNKPDVDRIERSRIVNTDEIQNPMNWYGQDKIYRIAYRQEYQYSCHELANKRHERNTEHGRWPRQPYKQRVGNYVVFIGVHRLRHR